MARKPSQFPTNMARGTSKPKTTAKPKTPIRRKPIRPGAGDMSGSDMSDNSSSSSSGDLPDEEFPQHLFMQADPSKRRIQDYDSDEDVEKENSKKEATALLPSKKGKRQQKEKKKRRSVYDDADIDMEYPASDDDDDTNKATTARKTKKKYLKDTSDMAVESPSEEEEGKPTKKKKTKKKKSKKHHHDGDKEKKKKKKSKTKKRRDSFGDSEFGGRTMARKRCSRDEHDDPAEESPKARPSGGAAAAIGSVLMDTLETILGKGGADTDTTDKETTSTSPQKKKSKPKKSTSAPTTERKKKIRTITDRSISSRSASSRSSGSGRHRYNGLSNLQDNHKNNNQSIGLYSNFHDSTPSGLGGRKGASQRNQRSIPLHDKEEDVRRPSSSTHSRSRNLDYYEQGGADNSNSKRGAKRTVGGNHDSSRRLERTLRHEDLDRSQRSRPKGNHNKNQQLTTLPQGNTEEQDISLLLSFMTESQLRDLYYPEVGFFDWKKWPRVKAKTKASNNAPPKQEQLANRQEPQILGGNSMRDSSRMSRNMRDSSSHMGRSTRDSSRMGGSRSMRNGSMRGSGRARPRRQKSRDSHDFDAAQLAHVLAENATPTANDLLLADLEQEHAPGTKIQNDIDNRESGDWSAFPEQAKTAQRKQQSIVPDFGIFLEESKELSEDFKPSSGNGKGGGASVGEGRNKDTNDPAQEEEKLDDLRDDETPLVSSSGHQRAKARTSSKLMSLEGNVVDPSGQFHAPARGDERVPRDSAARELDKLVFVATSMDAMAKHEARQKEETAQGSCCVIS